MKNYIFVCGNCLPTWKRCRCFSKHLRTLPTSLVRRALSNMAAS